MNSINFIIISLIVVAPSIALACTPRGATIGNFQTKQEDVCYVIDDFGEQNNCNEPVRVFFGGPILSPQTKPLGEEERIFLERVIENRPDCYPKACTYTLIFVVGPEEIVIDKDYKTNPELTVFTYTYEIQGVHPDEIIHCSEFDEYPDEMDDEQPTPTNTESDKQAGGCGSVHHYPPGLVWLFLLGVFIWFNKRVRI